MDSLLRGSLSVRRKEPWKCGSLLEVRAVNPGLVVPTLERTLGISFQSLCFIIEKAAAERKQGGCRGRRHILELSSQARVYPRHRSHTAEKSLASRSPQLPFLLVPTSPIMSVHWKQSISGQGLQLRPPTHPIPKGEVDTWVEVRPVPLALEWLKSHLETFLVCPIKLLKRNLFMNL